MNHLLHLFTNSAQQMPDLDVNDWMVESHGDWDSKFAQVGLLA